MSDWTCGRCGTRVLSGLSHACHYSTGGNINYSEQVEPEGRLMAENQRRGMTLEEYAEKHRPKTGWPVPLTAAELFDYLRADGYRVVKLVEQTNEHGVLLSMAVAEELT